MDHHKMVDAIAQSTGIPKHHLIQSIRSLAIKNKLDANTVVHKLYHEYIGRPHILSKKDTIKSITRRLGLRQKETEKLIQEVDDLLKKPS